MYAVCMFLHEEFEFCFFGNKCLRDMCQYKHLQNVILDDKINDNKTNNVDAKESDTDKNRDDVKVATNETKCVVCQSEFHSDKRYKCEECGNYVCNYCHKKTFIDKDLFMCLVCQ